MCIRDSSKYSDLKSAFKGDDIDLLAHFVNNGMKEGRQASKKFNVQIYKNNYMDLQQAFGNDLKPVSYTHLDVYKRQVETNPER